ncbi:MAG: PilZ domain-containing protein, partial [Alphaproteobacteria bacterium]|nr:PilZ domain-containing protein [Alphaproteobacteria bacterium]
MLLRMRALFADASGQDSDGSTTPPTDRRDYERADVNSDVMVQYGDRLLAGQLRDVSISGALVEAD